MTTIDAQTVAAIRERYSKITKPDTCPKCGKAVYQLIGKLGTTAYCTHNCGWFLALQKGDPAVLDLLDAYEGLVQRIRGIEVQSTFEDLMTFDGEWPRRLHVKADASALAALKAEVGG